MRKPTIRLAKAKNCPLCRDDVLVDFKDINLLKRHLSERGKILGRVRTGICARHQRQVTNAINRARYMAFLPFSQA